MFFTLSQKPGALSLHNPNGTVNHAVHSFMAYMGKFFSHSLDRFDDEALAFLLSMIASNPPNIGPFASDISDETDLSQPVALPSTQRFVSCEVIRHQILRILAQNNFSVTYFTTMLGASFRIMSSFEHNPGVERKFLPVREDLDFWYTCCTYVPRLKFDSQS